MKMNTCEQCGREYEIEESFAEENERFCKYTCQEAYYEELED